MTIFDKLKDSIKNNRFGAVILLAAVGFIGISQVIDSWDKIGKYYNSLFSSGGSDLEGMFNDSVWQLCSNPTEPLDCGTIAFSKSGVIYSLDTVPAYFSNSDISNLDCGNEKGGVGSCVLKVNIKKSGVVEAKLDKSGRWLVEGSTISMYMYSDRELRSKVSLTQDPTNKLVFVGEASVKDNQINHPVILKYLK